MKRLDRELLQRTLRQRLEADMASCRVSGAHLLVLQERETVCELCEGYQDWDAKLPLGRNAIYRLASMTKPVTGVAVLIAMEKGLLDIYDKVSDYLPEYEAMRIARMENGQVVPGERSQVPLRIWHLLSHCNGIMAEVPIGEQLCEAIPREAYASVGSMSDYCAGAPLAFEPESFTAYTGRASFDVAARIIELRSGMKYADFLRKYLFAPLNLKDMTYHPSEAQWDRMVVPTDRAEGMGLVTVHMGRHTYEGLPLGYTSAGAGLVSSMHDYAVFAQMLQERGSYGGRQIFSRELWEELTRPRIPDGTPGRDPVSNWGLGVRVVVKEEVLPVGSFGWSGAYGTHFWVDPVNRITAVYLRASRWYDSHGCGSIGLRFEKDVMDGFGREP